MTDVNENILSVLFCSTVLPVYRDLYDTRAANKLKSTVIRHNSHATGNAAERNPSFELLVACLFGGLFRFKSSVFFVPFAWSPNECPHYEAKNRNAEIDLVPITERPYLSLARANEIIRKRPVWRGEGTVWCERRGGGPQAIWNENGKILLLIRWVFSKRNEARSDKTETAFTDRRGSVGGGEPRCLDEETATLIGDDRWRDCES
ncbi:hypothetical protein GWI33_023307 [Rhynchophorus ferrugineus]|uniref:Uncharacterized protein n=1 Tax=Rhynchophorus ferrugineus TaxID=354439 RepID=A0A834M2G5_RHYFE|nr:hypothetical protein GWI33_023307 [Rhynchophorus ferrugineus]